MEMKQLFGKFVVAVFVLSVFLLGSCGNNDKPYFSQQNYAIRCYLDSVKEYTLEDVVGRQLDASCRMTNEHDNVVELQVEQKTGKHNLMLKGLGFSHINVLRNGEKASVSVDVVTEAIERKWQIFDRAENVVCTPDLKETILDDMYHNLVVPKMSLHDRVVLDFGNNGKWQFGFFVGGTLAKILDFDYDKVQKEYSFYSLDEPDKRQTFTFQLISKEKTRKAIYKKGYFSCDLTSYYQKKYGAEKVGKVIVTYLVGNDVVI